MALPRDRQVLVGVLLLVAVAILRCAWVCDDAFITLRTVDNFLHGHGLTWNPPERVQVFTHPLWLAVLIVADILTPSGYWAVMLASLAFTGAACWLVLRRARPEPAVLVAMGAALALSRAFVDYGTSGLENPLAFVLCALALRGDLAAGTDASAARRNLVRLTLLASLLALTRLDLVLVILPPLVARAVKDLRAHWRAVLPALAPLVAWEIFAIIYFGFPLPNTAYAKLGAGVPAGELLRHGFWYLQATVLRDPLTAVVILAGVVLPAIRRDRARLWWALGVALYLAYVVRIGGDFMLGRFLAVPFLVAVVLAGDLLPGGRRGWVVAGVLALGLLVPRNPLWPARAGAAEPWFHGVADERAFYGPNTGLFARFAPGFTEHKFVVAGRNARRAVEQRGGATDVAGSVGFYGYYAGPRLRIIDVMALSDPFLARLPMARPDGAEEWRIGHFKRDLPAGYTETVSSTINRIEDPRLAKLYDEMRLVTTGPLFSGARWRAIVRLNLGQRPQR